MVIPSQISDINNISSDENAIIVKNHLISEIDIIQNTLNSIKYEMKSQRKVSHHES